MFAIIGYLFKQKYGKLDIILNTSQTGAKKKALEREAVDSKTTSDKKVDTLKSVKDTNKKSIFDKKKDKKNKGVQEVKTDKEPNSQLEVKETSNNGSIATEPIAEPSIMIQSTVIPNIKETVNNNQQTSPTTLPNIPGQSQNPIPMPNQAEEGVAPTPLKKEIEQDLTGAIPEIKF